MPLALYHFTGLQAAAAAIADGLKMGITRNDPLQVQGVWLSPNVYGAGYASFFGPIGLQIAETHHSEADLIYVGTHPRYPGGHRFLLVPEKADIPSAVERLEPPSGLPSQTVSCELLLLDGVPAAEIEGVRFGDEDGVGQAGNELAHARFLAHLLVLEHHLLGKVHFPHSTQGAPNSGWYTFAK